MSRILEFQSTDEQTVVARILVELHQAIDANFPNANPSAKQFTKTVITNQGESTRIDNMPPASPEKNPTAPKQAEVVKAAKEASGIHSMTPRTNHRVNPVQASIKTEEIKALMGESKVSHYIRIALLTLLVLGVITFIVLNVLGPQAIIEAN